MIQSRMGYSLIQIPLHPAISSYTRNHSIVSWWCIYIYISIYIYRYLYTYIHPSCGAKSIHTLPWQLKPPFDRLRFCISILFAQTTFRPPVEKHRHFSRVRGIAMIYVVFSSNYQSHSSKPQWRLSTDKWLPSTLDEITQKRCECWLFLSKNTGFAA